jgi:hypothetical protein
MHLTTVFLDPFGVLALGRLRPEEEKIDRELRICRDC